jgi:hypothetical protein
MCLLLWYVACLVYAFWSSVVKKRSKMMLHLGWSMQSCTARGEWPHSPFVVLKCAKADPLEVHIWETHFVWIVFQKGSTCSIGRKMWLIDKILSIDTNWTPYCFLTFPREQHKDAAPYGTRTLHTVSQSNELLNFIFLVASLVSFVETPLTW